MAYVELTDTRCYYEIEGQGDATLLVPGLGATCRDWDPVVNQLSRHLTLIRCDNRGVGRSEAKRPATTLHHYSADLVELLDHLRLERVGVIGLSLGGIIAQRLAMDHPDRVRRMVLISCAHRFGP